MELNATSVAVAATCTSNRNKGPSIVAALSTLAMAVVQNWGLGFDKPNTVFRLLAQVIFSPAVPPLSIAVSFSSADKARRLRSAVASTLDSTSLHLSKKSLSQLTSFMADCPIFIETPPSYKIEDIPVELYNELELHTDRIYKTHPLEIFPEMIAAQNSLHTSADPSTQYPPTLLATSSLLSRKKVLLNLSLNGKALLLILGLVPEYEKMRFIRQRSGLEILIFGLQGLGYLFGTIGRIHQHLDISPLEYLFSMVSIQMVFQAILQWFGCTYYDRPLLIHLDSKQFNRWASQTTKLTPRNNPTVDFILQVMLCLLYLVPTIYYGIHYMMPHRKCIHCSMVALLFLLVLVMALVSEFINLLEGREHKFFGLVYYFLLGMTNLVYVCSILLSLMVTTQTWKELFKESSTTLLKWIIPHVRGE